MGPIEGIAPAVPLDLEGQPLLTTLHRLPEIVINNSEFGNLDDLPKVFGIGSGHSLPRLRILDVGAAIPFEAANIEAIIEDARASIDLTSDRRIPPLAPIGAWDAFGVEGFGNGPRRLAGGELAKDATHHERLGFI
jgi:hypothetical protein